MLCWKDRGYSLVSGEIRVEHSRKKKKKKLAGDRLSKESERNKTLTFTLKDVCGVIYRAYLKTKLSPLSQKDKMKQVEIRTRSNSPVKTCWWLGQDGDNGSGEMQSESKYNF